MTVKTALNGNGVSYDKAARILQILAAELGVEVQISVRDAGEDGFRSVCNTTPEETCERLRNDLAWVQAYLEEKDRQSTYAGNYLAVMDGSIISHGPDEELTRIGSAKKCNVSPDEVLVIPVRVPGSEEYWENLRAELGIE